LYVNQVISIAVYKLGYVCAFGHNEIPLIKMSRVLLCVLLLGCFLLVEGSVKRSMSILICCLVALFINIYTVFNTSVNYLYLVVKVCCCCMCVNVVGIR